MFPPSASSGLPASFTMTSAPSNAAMEIVLDSKGLTLPGDQWITWAAIQEVNLSRVPQSKYNDRHLLCRIYSPGKPLQLRAALDSSAEVAGYQQFLQALHQGLQTANASPRYTSGMRGKTAYISLMSAIVMAFVALEFLVGYAVQQRGKLAMGFVFMAMIAIAGYGLLRLSYRMLRPATYDPATIPQDLCGL